MSTRFVISTLLLASLMACGSSGRSSGSGGATDGTVDSTDSADGGEGFQPGDRSDGADAGETDATDGSDGSDGADGSVAEADGTTPIDTSHKGFPSKELFLQIISPGARSHVTATASVVSIGGVLFGRAERITWTAGSGATGVATGDTFWQTEPITLLPGDNQIIITATDDAGGASVDSVNVTYSPGVAFESPAVARPDAFFTSSDMRVAVSVRNPGPSVMPGSFMLWEVDATGNTVGQIGAMKDSGDLGLDCDEIQDDGVYSRCVQMQNATATVRYLRVTASVQQNGSLVTLFSPLTPIEIVDPVTPAECASVKSVQDAAIQAYNGALGSGALAAADAAIASLKSSSAVESAGMNEAGYGIWVRFQSGLLGGLDVGRADTRGGAGDGQFGDRHAGDYGSEQAGLGNERQILSRKVLALAPASSQFGPLDEVVQIASQLASQQCPAFGVQGPYQNGAATLSQMRRAYDAGILLFSGHADTYFTSLSPDVKQSLMWEHDGSQEILWSGEAVDCSRLSASHDACYNANDCPAEAQCVFNDFGPSGVCVDRTAIDLRRGRVIIGASTYGVHANFFARYAERAWPDSLVYLGACRTLFNGTLAAAMFGAGAKAVAGYNDYVDSAFASEQGKAWFTEMLAGGATSGFAASFPVSQPSKLEVQFQLFGAKNLTISESEILNPSWETGDTTGWDVAGDGRVIGRLGATLAVGGKFMGIISTGLGYTDQTGELSQSFCIPNGAESMSFSWRFYSEEFTDFCGSEYQDTFEAQLETTAGSVKLVSANVDALCGPSDCFGCGGQYFGLTPSDVAFDQGDVYNTPWKTETIDVKPFAGAGPVTLRLFSTDVGDSIYDSAILIDGVNID